MTDGIRRCSADFDEALISGYLDGELTQQDNQRVRLHLEECDTCRQIADELRQLKEATMSTKFEVPDTQWDETPRGGLSQLMQTLGWLLAGVWVVGYGAFLIWAMTADGDAPRYVALLGLIPMLVIGLIVGSALIDRLQTRKNDPYRQVKK